MRRERESQLSFSALCENRLSVILLRLLGRRQLHSLSNIVQSSRIKIKVLGLQQSYCKLNNGVFVNKQRRCFFFLAPNAFGVILALLKPYCCKLFRHVNSYQHQVFFTFSQGFSLPCAVLTCAYWLSNVIPTDGSAATSLHKKRQSKQKREKEIFKNKPKSCLLCCCGNPERALYMY